MAARNKHDRKAPLWRRENTTTHGVRRHGGEYRRDRNTKVGRAWEKGRITRGVGSRRAPRRHDARDYTPLFRFLLSKVGGPWDVIHAEATSRLDDVEPIGWLVAERGEKGNAFVRVGETTFFSGLYVNDAGRLAKVDPSLTLEHLAPYCACCTHTFNGDRFVRPFDGMKNGGDVRHHPTDHGVNGRT